MSARSRQRLLCLLVGSLCGALLLNALYHALLWGRGASRGGTAKEGVAPPFQEVAQPSVEEPAQSGGSEGSQHAREGQEEAPRKQLQWRPGRGNAPPAASSHTPKAPVLAALPPPAAGETPSALLSQLKACSKALGITPNEQAMAAVSHNASLFLSALRSMVPHQFTPGMANFCWKSNYSFATLDNIRTNFVYHSQWVPLPSTEHRPKATPHSLDHSRWVLTKQLQQQQQQQGTAGHGTLLCLPNFYLAGFPKSATTSLAQLLNAHPHVYGPVGGKEPHWLTRYHFLYKLSPSHEQFQDHATLSALKYLLYFMPFPHNFTSDLVTYDGSQSTLWDSPFFHAGTHTDYCALPVVLQRLLPAARFVVLLRNPVTRTYSDFLWSCNDQYHKFSDWPAAMRRNARSVFSSQFKHAVSQFQQCVFRASPYECYLFGQQVEQCGKLHIARIAIGLYHMHLRKWLQVFPREQFLFLRTEDFSADPIATMKRVTEFLGIREYSKEQRAAVFAKKENVNLGASSLVMTAGTMKLLSEFFQPYNEKLALLLGDDRFLWND